jgi:hypothetical protein
MDEKVEHWDSLSMIAQASAALAVIKIILRAYIYYFLHFIFSFFFFFWLTKNKYMMGDSGALPMESQHALIFSKRLLGLLAVYFFFAVLKK